MTANIVSKTPKEFRDSWRTPLPVFRWAQHIVGSFNFDTACTYENALAHPIWLGDGEPIRMIGNALNCEWAGVCWCNPPYSNIDPRIDKAFDSHALTVLLIPSPNGEERYYRLMRNAHEISIVGRLTFINADGLPVSGNTRGSSLFIFDRGSKLTGTRSIIHRNWIYRNFSK